MRSTRPSAQAVLGCSILAVAVLALAGCGPKYPKCSKDDHCAEKGELCVDGMCQQCRDDSNCPEGQQCKGGRCEVKPECSTDGDCTDNKVCRSGKCQIECQGDADCGSGMKCKSNRCVDELACSLDTDCPTGLSCQGGRCSNVLASRSMGCSYPTVRFPFNEATLTDSVKKGLQEAADCLKTKTGKVIIEGHCDERGTEEYNLALGDRRARAVRQYLERLGIAGAKLEIVSKGEAQPLDSSSSEEAWEKNRRAEFIER